MPRTDHYFPSYFPSIFPSIFFKSVFSSTERPHSNRHPHDDSHSDIVMEICHTALPHSIKQQWIHVFPYGIRMLSLHYKSNMGLSLHKELIFYHRVDARSSTLICVGVECIYCSSIYCRSSLCGCCVGTHV